MALPDIQDAVALLEQGNPEEAATLLEQITDVLPGYTSAHVLQAHAYELCQQWPQAIQAWKRAHFLMANSPVIAQGLQRTTEAAQRPTPSLTLIKPEPRPAPTPDPTDLADPVDLSRSTEPAPPDAPPAPFAEPPTEAPDIPSWLPVGEMGSPASKEGEESIHELDDLDRLIEELEGARIVPQPDIDDLPAPNLESNIDDMVSETLARIYAAQKQFEEAAIVYEQLAGQQPDRAAEYLRKADEMRSHPSS